MLIILEDVSVHLLVLINVLLRPSVLQADLIRINDVADRLRIITDLKYLSSQLAHIC